MVRSHTPYGRSRRRRTVRNLKNITMKYDFRKFYIGGEWALPSSPNDYQVINPATEEVVGVISLGSIDDAARAVAAAKKKKGSMGGEFAFKAGHRGRRATSTLVRTR